MFSVTFLIPRWTDTVYVIYSCVVIVEWMATIPIILIITEARLRLALTKFYASRKSGNLEERNERDRKTCDI